MTEALYVSTFPVFEIEGEVNSELARDILRLEIEETTAGLKTLMARLIAQGATGGSSEQQRLYLDGSVIDFGKKLKVAIGSDAEARTVFSGWISAIEATVQEGQAPE